MMMVVVVCRATHTQGTQAAAHAGHTGHEEALVVVGAGVLLHDLLLDHDRRCGPRHHLARARLVPLLRGRAHRRRRRNGHLRWRLWWIHWLSLRRRRIHGRRLWRRHHDDRHGLGNGLWLGHHDVGRRVFGPWRHRLRDRLRNHHHLRRRRRRWRHLLGRNTHRLLDYDYLLRSPVLRCLWS